jgi:cytochrome P450
MSEIPEARRTAAAPPPGTSGPPLIGETVTMLRNPFAYIARRRAHYGAAFRANVLGRNTVFMAGPEAWVPFLDLANVTRERGRIASVQRLFGGPNLNSLDGAEHRLRKGLLLQAFTNDALAAYLPTMQQLVGTTLHRWAQRGEVRGIDELRGLAIEVLCANIAGLEPGPRLDRLRRLYTVLLPGMAALPVPLPWTRYGRALHALPAILAALDEIVREHRQQPGADGLSRMLAARGPQGEQFTDAQARLELHHIVVAGFIVHGVLAGMILLLTRHPAVRARLEAEIGAVAPSGSLTVDQFARMPYLSQVVMEVKRVTPILPAIFGEARRPFAFNGQTIPAGWRVGVAIRSTNLDAATWTDAGRFDPDRFAPDRAEQTRHPYAFSPQGAGAAETTHRCAGLDYTTYVLTVFTILLLRGYTWDLPPQNLTFAWHIEPPAPRDGLRLRLHGK